MTTTEPTTTRPTCPFCLAALDVIEPEERAAHVYACQRENERQLRAYIDAADARRAARPRQPWVEEI